MRKVEENSEKALSNSQLSGKAFFTRNVMFCNCVHAWRLNNNKKIFTLSILLTDSSWNMPETILIAVKLLHWENVSAVSRSMTWVSPKLKFSNKGHPVVIHTISCYKH